MLQNDEFNLHIFFFFLQFSIIACCDKFILWFIPEARLQKNSFLALNMFSYTYCKSRLQPEYSMYFPTENRACLVANTMGESHELVNKSMYWRIQLFFQPSVRYSATEIVSIAIVCSWLIAEVLIYQWDNPTMLIVFLLWAAFNVSLELLFILAAFARLMNDRRTSQWKQRKTKWIESLIVHFVCSMFN